MKKRGLLSILVGMAVLSFTLFNSCEIGLGESVDTAAPSIKIDSPNTSAIIRDAFAIKGTWSDDGTISRIEVILTNTETKKEDTFGGQMGSGDNWSCVINPKEAGIKDGKYEATIRIYDNGGHSTTTSRAFVIDNTPPVVVLSKPSSSSTETDTNKIESYGQYLTLEGQAADDNDIEKIIIRFYSKDNPAKLLYEKEITSIPPTISLDVAKFLDNDVYSAIYGNEKEAGEKEFTCEIIAYDGAKRYPLAGQEKADDNDGNPEPSFILWSDWEKFQTEYQKATGSTSKIKIPDLYSMKAGKTTSDTNRTVVTESLITNLFKKAVSAGSFKLNPLNNPTFSISGLDLAKANDVENERPLTIQLSKGLDGISLDADNMKVYLIPVSTDANGKEVRGNKIYPQNSEYQKKGDGQFFTTIQKDNCKDAEGNDVSLEYSKTYVIGVEGTDTENNKIVASFDGKEFYMIFKAKNVAPGLTITSPAPTTSYLKKGDKLLIKGTTSVPDGTPVISITCKEGDAVTGQEIYSHKVTAADKEKVEAGLNFYNFEFEVPIDGNKFKFNQNKSETYVFDITSDMDNMPTIRTKTVIYDVECPTISIDSMLPTAEKYTGAEDGSTEQGEYLNGDVTMKVAILDDDVINTEIKDSNNDKRPYFIIEDANTHQQISFRVGTETVPTVKHYITTPAKQSFVIHTEDIAAGSLSRKVKVKIFAQDRAGNLGVDIDDKSITSFEREYTVDQSTDIPVILPYNDSTLTLTYDTEAKIDAALSKKIYKSVLTTGSDLLLSIKDDDGIKNYKFYRSETNTALQANATAIYDEDLKNVPSDYTFRYPGLPTIAGKYECKIIIEDIVGKTKEKDFWIVVTGAAPQVNISSTTPDNKIITLSRGEKEADAKVKFENTVTIESGYNEFTVSRIEKIKKLNGDIEEKETVLYGQNNLLTAHSFTDIFVPASNCAENKIKYAVTDEMEHVGEREFTYYIDSKKPEIDVSSIKVPSNKNTESSSFKFEAKATDVSEGSVNDGKKASDVSKIQYTFDSAKASDKIKTVPGVSSLNEKIEFKDADYSYAFASEGIKTIYIRAIDDVGNIGDWTEKSFMYDTNEPALNITSYKRVSEALVNFAENAATKSFETGEAFTLNGTVSDNTGIKTFEIWQKKDGEGHTYSNELGILLSRESNKANGSWTITGLPKKESDITQTDVDSGTYIYTIRAIDNSEYGTDSAKETKAFVTVKIDKTNPTVSIDLAQGNTNDSTAYGDNSLKGNAYTFRGTAKDDPENSGDFSSGFDTLWYAFTTTETEPDWSLFDTDEERGNHSIKPSTDSWSIPMNLLTVTESNAGTNTSDTLKEGKHFLYVKGKDKAGNYSATKHVAFMVDQNLPKVTCNVYKNGDTQNSLNADNGIVKLNATHFAQNVTPKYTLSGTAWDANGIDSVKVFTKRGDADPVEESNVDFNSQTGAWSVVIEEQGSNVHTIEVYDKSGRKVTGSSEIKNKSNSTTASVIFDTVAPSSLTIKDFDTISTAKTKWLSGTGENYVSGTAKDNESGLAEIWILIDKKDSSTAADWTLLTLAEEWTHKFSVTGLTENDDDTFHTITIKAVDKAGNESTETSYFRYDKTAPEAELEVNKNDQFVNKADFAALKISGYAHDGRTDGRGVGSAKIKVVKDGDEATATYMDVTTTDFGYVETAGNTFGNFSKTGFDSDEFDDGKYTFTLEVKDKAKNPPSGTSTLTATLFVDTTAPKILETKLVVKKNENTTEEKDSISSKNPKATIQVTFEEDNVDTVSYYVDDSSVYGRTQENAPEDDWVSMNKDTSYSGTGLRYTKAHQFNDGKGKVYIKVVDKAGNISYGTALNYEVDTKAPDVCTLDKVKVEGTELTGTKLVNGSKDVVFTVTTSDYNDNYKEKIENGVTTKVKIGNDNTKVASVAVKSIGNTSITGVSSSSATNETNGLWTITIPAGKIPATSGSVTVTVTDNLGNSKDYPSLFNLDIDKISPRLENYSLSSSYDAGVVNSIQTYYMNNKSASLKLEGIAKDDRNSANDSNGEIEKVTLTLVGKVGNTSTTKILTSTEAGYTFEIKNDAVTGEDNAWKKWSNWKGEVTGTLKVIDKAKNESEVKEFKIIFDTAAPLGVHAFDKTGKDLYFRVGEQNRDDGIISINGNTITSEPSWNAAIDNDVGGKYSSKTQGNTQSLKIRGNFVDKVSSPTGNQEVKDIADGSGLAMIYYIIYTSTPDLSNILTNKAYESLANGYFSAIKKIDETQTVEAQAKRRVFFSSDDGTLKNNLGEAVLSDTTKKITLTKTIAKTDETSSVKSEYKYYTDITSTFRTAISGLKENSDNYLVLVAVDNVGNAGYETIKISTSDEKSYYTINVDTTPPVASPLEEEKKYYVNSEKTDETISIWGTVTDARAGISQATLKISGNEIPTDLFVNGEKSTITKINNAEIQASTAASQGYISLITKGKVEKDSSDPTKYNIQYTDKDNKTVIIERNVTGFAEGKVFTEQNAAWKVVIKNTTFKNKSSGVMQLTVKDNAGLGNKESYNIGSFVEDNTAPVVTIKEITNAGIVNSIPQVNGEIKISGAIEETYLKKVSGYYKKTSGTDTNHPLTITSSNSWESTLDTTALADNTEYIISITATDEAGNIHTAQSPIKVNQDSDRPVVKFSALSFTNADAADNTVWLKHQTELYGTVTDDDGLSTAEDAFQIGLILSGSTITWENIPVTNGSWSFDLQDFYSTSQNKESDANGEKQLYFKVKDSKNTVAFESKAATAASPADTSHNIYICDKGTTKKGSPKNHTTAQTEESTILTLTVDTLPPVIELKGGKLTNDASYDLSVSSLKIGGEKSGFDIIVKASDGVGLKTTDAVTGTASLTLSETNIIQLTANVSSVSEGGATHKLSFALTPENVTTLRNAQYNSFVDIKITAEDRAGNKYNASTQINADFKAPAITFTSPVTSLDNAESGDATLIFTTDEVGTVYYTISTDGTTKPSAPQSITSYKYYEVNAAGIPSSTAKTGTISSTVADYVEITTAKDKITGTLYIDDKTAPEGIHTGAQLKSYLETFGITNNAREYTPFVDFYVWIKSEDAIGNISETAHKIILNPQGDRPTVTINYPDTNDTTITKLGNVKLTVRGIATDNSGNGLDSVWLQIVPATHSSGTGYTTSMTVNNKNEILSYSLNDNDLNYMKNILKYDVYKIGTDTPWNGTFSTGETASDYGIKVVLSGNSWSYTINKSGELKPYGDKVTNNPVYLRAFAYDKDGNKSYETTKYFQIDTSIPSVDSYTLKQYEADGITVKSSQPYTSGSTYYLKGQWYLEFKAVPHNGSGSSNGSLGDITIKKNDSDPETYTVGDSDSGITWCTINDNDGSATIKYPIVTEDDATNKKVGQTKLSISVSDSTDNSTPYTSNVEVSFDNEAPTLLSDTNEYNIPASVKQSSGWYTLSSKIKEERNGSSGLKAVAFYFLRRNTVDNKVYIYDPMIKHSSTGNKQVITDNSALTYDSGLYWKSHNISAVAGSSFTMSDTDENIHVGSFVQIKGVLYIIKSINGTTYRVDKDVDTSATTAKFALANIVDNTSSESARDNADRVLTAGIDYGYGYYETSDIKNDDGDRMIEGISGTSSNPTWEASIYSRNIPDGPIEIHYVAFDKAGNYSIGIVGNSEFNTFKANTGLFDTDDVTEVKGNTAASTGYGNFVYSYNPEDKAYVSNNAPRLAAVQIGLDINSNNKIDSDEWHTSYGGLTDGATSNKLVVTGANGAVYKTVKGKTALKPEIIGGNGSIYYSYAMGTKDGTQAAVEAITETNRTKVTTPLVTSGSIDGETTDVIAINDGIVLQVGDFIRLANTKADNKYYCPDGNYWFNFKLWDSTESTTKFIDSQNAQISVRFALNLNDENNPDMTLVEPVKVEGKGHVDSSASWMTETGTDYDHQERGKTGFVASQYDSDPKVSGQIVITGTLNDDIVLHHMYLKSDAFTGLSNSIVAATYDPTKELSETVTSRWTVATATLPAGITLVMGEDTFDDDGHHVPYTLTIDTAESKDVAMKDVYVEIYADDFGKPTLASLPTSSTGIYTYSLSQKANNSANSTQYMDIVPYITEVTRANTKISAGTMNRSNIGRYPVAEGETIKVTGYNLATSGAWTVGTHNTETAYTGTKAADGTYSFTMTVPARSGKLSVKVNSVVSLNNGNDNSQTYNTETFNMSGTSTTYTASDDRYLSIWNLGNYFKNTNNGAEVLKPEMTADANGNMYAAWVAQSNSNVMFSYGISKKVIQVFRCYDQPSAYSSVSFDTKGNSTTYGGANIGFIPEHQGSSGSFSNTAMASNAIIGGAATIQITKDYINKETNPVDGLSAKADGNPGLDLDSGGNKSAFYTLASYDMNRRLGSFESPHTARFEQYLHNIWYDNVTEGLKYSVTDVSEKNKYEANVGAVVGWVVIDGGYTGQDRVHKFESTAGKINNTLVEADRFNHSGTGLSQYSTGNNKSNNNGVAKYNDAIFLSAGYRNTEKRYMTVANDKKSLTIANTRDNGKDYIYSSDITPKNGDTIALMENTAGNYQISLRTITVTGNTISWDVAPSHAIHSATIYTGNMNVVDGNNERNYENFTRSTGTETNILANSTSAGSSAAIDVTTQGYPVIAYYDAANSQLRVAVASSKVPDLASEWTRYNTGMKCSGEVCMKVDGANNIHIMYNNEDGKMCYLYCAYTANGYTWGQEEVVDDTGSLAYGSISVIYNGTTYVPAMTWLNKANTANAVKYAYRTVAPAAANASTGTWDFMIIPALGNGHYALKENKVSIESRNNWTSNTETVLQNRLIATGEGGSPSTATPATVQSVLAYKTSAAYETAYLKTE